MDGRSSTIDRAAYPERGSWPERLRFLLRYAVLAPSNRNAQPWRFVVEGPRVCVFLDERRWLRVADPDRRELRLSAGCAIENLLVAAEGADLLGRVAYFPDPERGDLVAEIAFTRGAERLMRRPRGLFEAIEARHTNRRPYDGRPLPEDHANRLRALAEESATAIHLVADAELRTGFARLVRRADAIQYADPAWREEMGRCTPGGAFADDGLVAKLVGAIVARLDLGGWVGTRDARLVRGASAIGVVTTSRSGRTTQVRAGQVFERLWLGATALGMSLQPMNSVLQIPDTRARFVGLLPPAWGTPQVAFRIGYARPQRGAPRRPPSAVIG